MFSLKLTPMVALMSLLMLLPLSASFAGAAEIGVDSGTQTFTIPSIWFSDLNDLDSDGYYSTATVHWDANVSFGSATVTAQIYADAGSLSVEQYLGAVGSYTITGDSSSDWRSFSIATSGLSRDDFQIKDQALQRRPHGQRTGLGLD